MKRIALRHWTGSALLHAALILGLLWMQWHLRVPRSRPPIVEWQVSFAEPPPSRVQAPRPPIERQTLRAARPLPTPRPAPRPEPRVVQQTLPEAPPPPTPPALHSDPAPVAAPPPPPPPPPAPVPQVAYADGGWVGQALSGLMNAHKRYPLQARRMGVEGKVVIRAVIDAQGHVVDAGIKDSSGSPILDRDALALLRSIPPIRPENLKLAARTVVEIPISYVLEQ